MSLKVSIMGVSPVIKTVIILSFYVNTLRALIYQRFSLVIWNTLAFVNAKLHKIVMLVSCDYYRHSKVLLAFWCNRNSHRRLSSIFKGICIWIKNLNAG